MHVIQGIHLIPAFNDGLTSDILEPSLACLPQGDYDYCFYYVNMLVLQIALPMLLLIQVPL